MVATEVEALRAFRAGRYACLGRRRDALFEVLDALLASGPCPSLPHLSLAPGHRRGWGSVYAALRRGQVHLEALRALLRRRALLRQLQQLRNRQGAAGYTACEALVAELQAPVEAVLTAQVDRVDRELAQLTAAETPLGAQLRALMSIPGLGRTTAATILASLPVERLATRRQVAAYAGLCPRERTSGSSVRGRSRTGPLGPASLRKALYLPAVVAMRANPALRAFAERLRTTGKCPKVVIVAVMRKLLELPWTLLRSGQPFSRSQGSAALTP